MTTGWQWASSPVASTALPGVTKAHAEVLAIVSWDKERPEPEYQTGLRNETWEIVVTELMFEPDVPRQLYLPVGVNQLCRFTSLAWPRCWAALVR